LSFTLFHLMLRHKTGQDVLRKYLMQLYGISGLVNDLDMWIAVQEWRKIGTNQKLYHSKAIAIFEIFIVKDAPRRVDIDIENIDELIRDYTAVKLRENKGFYKLAVAKPNLLRQLVGWDGKEYEQWTTEQILNPVAFDPLEWKCFQNMYNAISKDANFLTSSAYSDFCVARLAEERDRDLDFVETTREREC
jgi:hypothetical protein